MREPKPVQRVELTEKNRKLRIIAAVALLVIGLVGIGVGITQALGREPGWQQVEITTQERNCSSEFMLQYNFSDSGAQATAVNRKLLAAYEEACVKAYQLFTADEEISGVHNIWYINRHPGEAITVDPVLYEAFEKLEGTRYLYLGPIYGHYDQIIYNSGEEYVERLDPLTDAQAAAQLQALADFARDPEMIRLELLGNDQVTLHVSPEYRAYLEAEELSDNLIDFAYMANAFIIDYLAETLIAQDLTDGYLVSADGYTRNLTAGVKFQTSLFDRVGERVYPAGAMEYQGPVSMVFLKDFPTSESDRNYRARDGYYIHLLADPADGICRTGTDSLLSYSYETGCAEVLLRMLPGFLGDTFAVPQGVSSIWFEGQALCYNDPALSVVNLLESEEVSYTAQLKK